VFVPAATVLAAFDDFPRRLILLVGVVPAAGSREA
jgi:hypothetical protein